MIISISSAYVVPLLKYINHPALIQEWKLNLDDAAYEKHIDANVSKTSDKKEIDRHDSNLYWSTSIKDTMQWVPSLAIMEHTANILKPNKGIIPSLLKVFAMFEMILIDDQDEMEAIAIRCINFKKKQVYI